MAVCVYDNPAYMMRECWQDGCLLVAYSDSILPDVARYPIPALYYFLGADIGPWVSGQMVGDPSAIADDVLLELANRDR